MDITTCYCCFCCCSSWSGQKSTLQRADTLWRRNPHHWPIASKGYLLIWCGGEWSNWCNNKSKNTNCTATQSNLPRPLWCGRCRQLLLTHSRLLTTRVKCKSCVNLNCFFFCLFVLCVFVVVSCCFATKSSWGARKPVAVASASRFYFGCTYMCCTCCCLFLVSFVFALFYDYFAATRNNFVWNLSNFVTFMALTFILVK